ncbi:DNA methyltransferase 1-associated protein 1 [Homalodisca vitripennis]|nr:DNA methyltransferase 1-associated protein 1 [Homalodisca vitripennis]
MVKPKAQIESRVNLKGLNTNARYHHSPGSNGDRETGAQIALAQGKRFRLDFSSGRRDRGARISLAQDESFHLDCSSGERERGAWIALVQVAKRGRSLRNGELPVVVSHERKSCTRGKRPGTNKRSTWVGLPGTNESCAEDICNHFNELRSDMVLICELKSALSTCEFELQTLRHRYEAFNPGKTLVIPPSLFGDSQINSLDTSRKTLSSENIDVIGFPSNPPSISG